MKINVKQVLSESVSFYKENFRNFIGISFVVFVFMAFMQAMGFTLDILTNSPLQWLLLFFLLMYGILIPAIIILPKVYLAMPILINSLLGENKLTTKQAYHLTKGKYWLMIGCSLLVGILYVPPMVIMIYAKIPFAAVISSIYTAFITSLFYTLFPMIAIEPRTDRYLRKSINMIKGNYIEVLILTFITATLLAVINGALRYILQGKTTELLIVGMVYAIVCFFVYPFTSTVTVIVYRQLKRSQEPFESIEEVR